MEEKEIKFNFNDGYQVVENISIPYVSYDSDADMYYVKLNRKKIDHQQFTNAVIDVDESGQIVGIEIFGFNPKD